MIVTPVRFLISFTSAYADSKTVGPYVGASVARPLRLEEASEGLTRNLSLDPVFIGYNITFKGDNHIANPSNFTWAVPSAYALTSAVWENSYNTPRGSRDW